jgi:hypothetical protein
MARTSSSSPTGNWKMKMTTESTVGTLMTEPMAMMAPLVITVPEMTTAIEAAGMMMATSVWFLQSSVIDFQAPTGGSVTVNVSSQ